MGACSEPTEATRSALMGRVRQSGTAQEQSVGRILREAGFAYRRNVRALPGSPDFANRKRKWALFVNGCFWHGHRNCRLATMPKTNRAFWQEKFAANRRRDARAIRELRRRGYKVVVVWGCRIDDDRQLARRLSDVLESGRV